jgi:hypothetical protein
MQVLPDPERRQLADLNDTQADYPCESLAHELIEE